MAVTRVRGLLPPRWPASLSSRNSSRCMVSLPAATCPLVRYGVAAVEVADKAAGFAHQKNARGHVPRRQIALPIGVETAGRDIGKVERGGAEAAQPGEMPLRGENLLPGLRKIAAAVMRQPAGDHGLGKLAPPGDAQPAVVEERALAALGDIKLVVRRIVGRAPATMTPSRSSAIDTAKCGMPCRKFVVPSSGSTIQRCVLSLPGCAPPSSPRNP